MTRHESIFKNKKKIKKDSPWDKMQVRSLSSSNLNSHGSIQYSTTPPLLTQNLSFGRQRTVQRSMSSGTTPSGSFLGSVTVSYPHSSAEYELLSICGTGATAKVYKAFCKPLKQLVAVKQVDLELAGQNLDTIIQEAKLLSQLRHPNILPMLACFVEESFLYMVMPYVVGGSVESAMQYGFSKGLEERVIVPIMLSVLHALAYLHKNSIVHRDVKASNILLNHQVVVLSDFGIATEVERNLESNADAVRFGQYLRRHSYVGTPVWMAPEVIDQCCGHGVKADIYAFGITILEMAMGRPPYAGMPFEGMFMSKIHHDPPELPCHHEDRVFSADMRDVVAQCLRREPDMRPTAAKLLKHRFFRFGRHPREATEELLAGIPGPVKRLDSLNRRVKEAAKSGMESCDFTFAGDERIPLTNIKSKDAAQATQQWGAKDALSVLHKMLCSSGLYRLDKATSGTSYTSSVDPSSPSVTSMTQPRRLSFASRQKSFAKGEQWPHLPAAALKHTKAIMFATGTRKGFGVQSAYGHAFVITNLGSPSGPCWTGPVYLYLTASKSVGLVAGEQSRESIVLFRDMKYNDMVCRPETFKLGDVKLIDAVGDNLSEDDMLNIMQEEDSKWNGIAFRHYATGKGTWKAASSSIMLDELANEKLYKKPVDPKRIMEGKEAPPVQFRGLIDVLISAQKGRYEKPKDLLSRVSAEESDNSLSRSVSHASFAKVSSGSVGPSSVTDASGLPELPSQINEAACCNLEAEFLMPPQSSFSMDDDTAEPADDLSVGGALLQPLGDSLSNVDRLEFSRPRGLLPRTASEPALPHLDEDLSWDGDAGTPPPYGIFGSDYYTSPTTATPSSPYLVPEIAKISSPASSKDSKLTSLKTAELRCTTSEPLGISPPNTDSSTSMDNPFLLASSATYSTSAEVLPVERSVDSFPSGTTLTPTSAKQAASWRPPKPGKPNIKSRGGSADFPAQALPPLLLGQKPE